MCVVRFLQLENSFKTQNAMHEEAGEANTRGSGFPSVELAASLKKEERKKEITKLTFIKQTIYYLMVISFTFISNLSKLTNKICGMYL